MSALSIVLIAALVLVGVAWVIVRNAFWGAAFVVTGLFLMASFGLLWWWVPVGGAVLLLIGALITLLIASGVGRALLAILTTAGILLAAFVGGPGLVAWFTTVVPNGGIDSIAFDPETDFLPNEAKCATNLFVDHSVRLPELGNPDKKQSSTAVSIPLKGKDDAAVLSEMLAENCGNPTVMVMHVDDMLLWDDSQIPGAEANKAWLNEIKATIAEATFGINSFVEAKSDKNAADTVSPLFQKYASWVNTVLLRSLAEGQQSLTSVRNWEVSGAWAPNMGLPVTQQATVQENKPAWVRIFKDKMGNCLLRFGWNAEDRRLEIFPCAEPAPPGTPGTPGTPETPGTPDNPGCTEPCNPTPCVYDCPKTDELYVDRPDGVTVEPNDEFEYSPQTPSTPAPTLPITVVPESDTTTEGATGADPNRETGEVSTGTEGETAGTDNTGTVGKPE